MKRGRRAACLAALAWGVPPAWAVESADGPEQALRDDADFAAGMAALRAGDAAAALGRFDRALRRFPEAADLHNELGYTHRRLGSLDKAFEHYRRALAIDPRHRGAHEYIGETYLLIDDLAGAERHLKALREICLLPCDEAKELQAAIDGYRAKRRPS